MGSLLFLIYINDIDESVCSNLLKFSDDTKLFGVVMTKDDVDRLQMDLRNLCKWSQDWLMLFNIEKFKVMHIGHNNVKAKYDMNNKYLEEVTDERDLNWCHYMQSECSVHCMKEVKTANMVFGMIKRTLSVRAKV